MGKVRAWTLKKRCDQEGCENEFSIKLMLTDRQAQDLGQRRASCKECSLKQIEKSKEVAKALVPDPAKAQETKEAYPEG